MSHSSRPVRTVRRAAGRTLRLLVAFSLAASVVLSMAVLGTRPAHAADAQIDSYAIDYTLNASGVLSVKETIVYRFGSDSGRHGIDRALVTRENDDVSNPGMDVVYTISHFAANSPSGANTDVSESTDSSNGGRDVETTYRIGNANEKVSADTATYVLSYDVTGAMRTSGSYDELYWDTTGNAWKEQIQKLTVTASVPGAPQATRCYVGPPKSTTSCDSGVSTSPESNPATFTQTSIAPGSGVTIGVKIKPGLIADNKPHLEPDASKLTPGEKVGVGAVAGVGLLAVVGAPLLGLVYWRRRGRDFRYLDVPPGTLAPGSRVGYSPRDIEIPVAFSPPQTTVAEAGLLVDGQVDTRETAATLVALAVNGAIKIDGLGDDEYGVRLLDPSRAQAPHETALLQGIFGGEGPGATKRLDSRAAIRSAHDAMVAQVRSEVTRRGWFRELPPAKAKGGIGIAALAVIGFILFQIAKWAVVLLLFAAPIVITIAVVRNKMRRGQRTADGRAICDQVDGFKKYLATAEAEQLRFEEGEDIFSKYLPWAIAFDLADRWASICNQLVQMGRLPDTQPYWYGGDGFSFYAFNAGMMSSSLSNAAAPPVSTGSGGGTGFGSGGSSFSVGGGFSGGGGGGGGGGGW